MKKSLKNILNIATVGLGLSLGILNPMTSQAQTTVTDLQTANILPDSLDVQGRNATYAGWFSTNNGIVESSDSVEVYNVDTLNSRLKTNNLILLNNTNSVDSAKLADLRNDPQVTLFETKKYSTISDTWTALKEVFKEYQFNDVVNMDPLTANGAAITMTDSATGNILGIDTIQAGSANFAFNYFGDSSLTANFHITKPNTLGKDTTVTLNKNDTINLGSLVEDYEFTFWGNVNNTWTNANEEGVNIAILDSASNDTLVNLLSDASGLYINNQSIHFTNDTIQARYILSKNGFVTADTTIQTIAGTTNETLNISPITYNYEILASTNVGNAIVTYIQGNDTLTIDNAVAGVIETHFTTLNNTETVELNVKDPATNAHFDLDTAFAFNQGTNGPLLLNLDSMYTINMNGTVESSTGNPLDGNVIFVNHYNVSDTLLNTQSVGGVYADTIYTSNPNMTIVDAEVKNVTGFQNVSNLTTIQPGVNTNNFVLDTVEIMKQYFLTGNGQENVSFNVMDLVADTSLINFTVDGTGIHYEQFESLADSIVAIYNLSAAGFENKADTVVLHPDPILNQYNSSLDQILHHYDINYITEEGANVRTITGNDTTNTVADANGIASISFDSYTSPIILDVEGSKINFTTKDTTYTASPDQVSNFVLPLDEKDLSSFFMYGGSNPDSVMLTIVPVTHPNDTLVNLITSTMTDSTGEYSANFQFEDSVFTAFVNAKYVGSNGTYTELNDTIQFEQGSNFNYFNLNPEVGINEVNNQSIETKLFPNPVQDNANIIYDPAQGKALLKIYDVTGKEVYQTSQPANEGNFEVPFSNEKAGTYIYEIKTNKGTDKKQFINK